MTEATKVSEATVVQTALAIVAAAVCVAGSRLAEATNGGDCHQCLTAPKELTEVPEVTEVEAF